ncbi:sterile alpha motif domain-containing protein 9-like [Hemicordylus capensis]|uniref:sterile alpha motif domain-containing protein 9-like n=1 Tax=Hemicordylus capensis TaxID=884348 RepID=UPI0023038CA5|nr:sterile alpha motif domain-containing protein 9-like [Hemicordylus capensis]XP_053159913.1 sterile alpha motif domain-containing protein 9-like [Hemicordylus capensis]XP_053159914.1 sterile alpha motif domain-containing protein 9-like [Hemicordylus capensis]XP_053159915.1 sterile alpha motif domain-containing protein 9-like [Hemicordylus capensis]
MDYRQLLLDEWNESHVKCWLKSIGIKKEYVEKLCEEEVTGPVLRELDEPFLKGMGMKGGQIHILMRKRNQLLKQNTGTDSIQAVDSIKATDVLDDSKTSSERKQTETREPNSLTEERCSDQREIKHTWSDKPISLQEGSSKSQRPSKKSKAHTMTAFSKTGSATTQILDDPVEPLHPSPFRQFRGDKIDFKYAKNTVLAPETGIFNLIRPCHEYKSFAKAALLDRQRLQAKFAYEVLKFASACMNLRTNGTIHFGVMDSIENKDWKHGQIVGIPISDKDMYVDALDYIEKCFESHVQEAARLCIHSPVFIEVISKATHEQYFVVEVDIEPLSNIVKGKIFQVCLPKFNDKTNKVNLEKDKITFQRVGTKSEPVKNEVLVTFIQDLQERDARREKAELSNHEHQIEGPQNLGRKLPILLTDGKNYMNDSRWYILVTNKCGEEDLKSIDFLMHLNIFCVFDFDEDSNVSGLYAKYKECHVTSSHFLKNYSNDDKMSPAEFQKHLCLFVKKSWIFCNGRSDFLGNEKPCDENTWIRTKKKYLKKAVSFICNDLLPKGSYLVLFLLLSPVEKPIIDTFHEFYSEMNGMDFIICLAESTENYEKWANLAQASCSIKTLEERSIVGMKLSHVDATIRNMLPSTKTNRHLPVSTKGVCILPTLEEEKMCSLEILCTDQCDDIKIDGLSEKEIQEMDETFYRGKKVSWKNFWLADNGLCGEVIEREACKEVSKMLNDFVYGNRFKYPVAKLKVFHHPGSGGSTIARQVLWKQRKDLRCAVIKTTYPVVTVCQQAVDFRHYDEKDLKNSLPVLLLVEDYDEEYLDELIYSLTDAMGPNKRHPSRPSFILLCCKQSNVPDKLCKASPQDTVAVTHKLTDQEKNLFRTKLEKFENQSDFKPEYILTFVLMSSEFDTTYVREFVEHLLKGIDLSSRETSLMKYVALLNFYVHNSYISFSHCEAFLGLGAYQETTIREYDFISHLSEQARLIFIELRETTTHISSIQIIHYSVAKEILNQLSGCKPQSEIAMELLQEKAFLHHRFGREEFIKFIRDLFIRRDKKSRGDNTDSYFSPFIEHICNTENPEKAIDVLERAYECLGKDAFFAQQLARLHYNYEKFEDGKHWAEIAKSHLPNDSFILDTEGQLYRKWFSFRVDKKTDKDTPEDIIQMIEIALKAMKCFRAAQQAAKSEKDSMNNAGYFGEVEVGCRLLKLLSTLDVFPKNPKGEQPELVQYLLTDYIPEDIKKPWGNLHSRLKGLQQNIYNALDWISEDLSYFQTNKNQTDAEDGREEQVHNPRGWLKRQCKVYATFFSSQSLIEENKAGSKTQLIRHMNIYKHGGGNITTILSFLSDPNDRKSVQSLEKIISFYSEDPQKETLEDTELINYILCHFTLACLSPDSSKLLDLQPLREISKRLYKKRRTVFPASAHFLLTLLYWPDAALDKDSNPDKDYILKSALDTLKHLHDIKMKDIAPRKKKIFTHFFLGIGFGLRKIIPKTNIDKLMRGSLDERRKMWQNGEVWQINEVHKVLKKVEGWTEDGRVFAMGHSEQIPILPLHFGSVPPGNENVTFYLGFSFNGLVAHNIQVKM